MFFRTAVMAGCGLVIIGATPRNSASQEQSGPGPQTSVELEIQWAQKSFDEMRARWAIADRARNTLALEGRTGTEALAILEKNFYLCEFSILHGLGLDPASKLPARADLPTYRCEKVRDTPPECQRLTVIISLAPQIVPRPESEYRKMIDSLVLGKDGVRFDCASPEKGE